MLDANQKPPRRVWSRGRDDPCRQKNWALRLPGMDGAQVQQAFTRLSEGLLRILLQF